MCFQKPPKFPSDVAREQTAAMERIANKQMDLQSEFMDWTRGFLEQNRELQDTVVARQLEQMSQQMEQSDELWSIAKDDRARYEADYLPFEQSLREEAATYATAERKQKEAASAQADVASAFNAARQNEQRRLESYGIDPEDFYL